MVTAPAGTLTSAFRALSEHATEGLAILDAERRFVFVNPAGAAILSASDEALQGAPALVFAQVAEADGVPAQGQVVIAGSRGGRCVQYTERFSADSWFVCFHDRTDQLRRDRHVTAFIDTATSATTALDQPTMLNKIAASVLEATGQAASTLVLFDRESRRVLEVGTAGGYPDDYAERLNGCVARGAPLASLGAFELGGPVVHKDWCDQVLNDHRWAPVHDMHRNKEWATLVAVPLKSRTQTSGSITLFCRRGQDPTPEDVEFMATIGEVAAVAIANYQFMLGLARESALEERYRIARELHDSVTQRIFSVGLRARALQLAAENADSPREKVAAGLGHLHLLVNEVLSDMRHLITHMRPEALQEDSLFGILRRHGERLAAENSFAFELPTSGAEPDLPERTEAELLRVLQEALNNVGRHAQASKVWLTCGPGSEPETVDIAVVDNGRGFDPARVPPGHFGLRTMRERVDLLGGRLIITSCPGRTVVQVTVPSGRTGLTSK